MNRNVISEIDVEKKNIVLSNDLIEAKYKLSALEQKIIHLLIAQIDLFDEDLKYYSLNVTEFSKIFGENNNNYARDMKRALEKLVTTKIEIKSKDTVLIASWFASAQYFKGGKIEIEFSRKLKPHLIGLKRSFTRYNLDYVIEFKSSYSIRIYQFLKQYQRMGIREVSLLALKEYLRIEKEYAMYAHFKAKVLNVAYDEINKNADISFKFEEIKKGRKVDKIKFYISNKKTEPAKVELGTAATGESEQDEDDLVDQLREIIVEKLKTKELKAILQVANNDVQLIENKYQLAKKQKKIENLVGWLVKAIEEDYTEPVEVKKKSKFNNMPERDYDYEDLEKELLGYK